MATVPNLSFVQCRSKNGAVTNLPNAASWPISNFIPGLSFVQCLNATLPNAGTFSRHYVPQPFFQSDGILWGDFVFGPGYVGLAYLEQWFLENVKQPVFFQLDSGALPPGLRLSTIGVSALGQIAGTPTTIGVYSFVLRAIGPQANDVKSFSIAIAKGAGRRGTAYVGGN